MAAEAEVGVTQLQDSSSPRRSQRGRKGPLEPPEGAGPAHARISDSCFRSRNRVGYFGSQPPSLWCSVRRPQDTGRRGARVVREGGQERPLGAAAVGKL